MSQFELTLQQMKQANKIQKGIISLEIFNVNDSKLIIEESKRNENESDFNYESGDNLNYNKINSNSSLINQIANNSENSKQEENIHEM